ncbi:MAG TPA: hypothetical protein VJS18_01690, partial [Paraburkholderia sp.]|nr:hypothetical protein [Paraburkholderia sp.]
AKLPLNPSNYRLLSALLRQQQRNEIMKTARRSVNRFFYFVQPAAQLPVTRRPSRHKAFARASRLPAPSSKARKTGILVMQVTSCKRFFDAKAKAD